MGKRHVDQLKERGTDQNDNDTRNTDPNEWDGAPRPQENPATIHEPIEETPTGTRNTTSDGEKNDE